MAFRAEIYAITGGEDCCGGGVGNSDGGISSNWMHMLTNAALHYIGQCIIENTHMCMCMCMSTSWHVRECKWNENWFLQSGDYYVCVYTSCNYKHIIDKQLKLILYYNLALNVPCQSFICHAQYTMAVAVVVTLLSPIQQFVYLWPQ